MKVFLTRHAHAGDRSEWSGDDRSRPLTGRGQAQARGLCQAVAAEGITRVMTSPFLRCIQTVEPLAEALGLPVMTERLLAEGSDWRETLDLVRDSAGPTVFCSQGDVIGGIVTRLAEMGLVSQGAARWQKGSTWALEVHDRSVVSATYIAPLEV
ncbi:MAG: histidine phosphatase family protein [Candidatus Dormibacteria bacterium]